MPGRQGTTAMNKSVAFSRGARALHGRRGGAPPHALDARPASSVVAPQARRRTEPRAPVAAAAAAAAEPAAAALRLAVGACCLPHPEKLATGGEDAYFVSKDSTALGVSDGVGGWAESGIDPGDYSRTLMRTACDFLDGALACAAPPSGRTALEALCRDAVAAAHSGTRKPGSATACVAALHPASHFLSGVNLGDSGFVLIRNGTVAYQTVPLQHFFDCPYQLGAAPDFVEDTDSAADAAAVSLNVVAGDVVVMATDGLWDNCALEELLQLVPDVDDDVDAAAEAIASLAREHAGDPEHESPYIVAARKQGYDLPFWEKLRAARWQDGRVRLGRLLGGKMDDVTVLVARVTDALPRKADGAHATPRASSSAPSPPIAAEGHTADAGDATAAPGSGDGDLSAAAASAVGAAADAMESSDASSSTQLAGLDDAQRQRNAPDGVQSTAGAQPPLAAP